MEYSTTTYEAVLGLWGVQTLLNSAVQQLMKTVLWPFGRSYLFRP